MATHCREFGISRPTGYKIWNRYKKMGELALVEQKRTPHRYANQLPNEVEALILDVKRDYPTWVVSFLDYDLGYFDEKNSRVEPTEDPFGLYIRDKV